jgi:pimeloyl-ACP methyl ester carboxylesterase/GNAT superfamily N-acetyltransferase
LLISAGVECCALDLPGHGEDGGPFGDLYSDVACVRETLDQFNGDVVLVGHSYGGAVITQAGLHPAVQHLVYVAAFALDEGESCVSAATAEVEAAQISHHGRPNLGAGSIMSSGDMITLDPARAAECLYNDCDVDTVAWALARLGPQPLITLQGTPKLAAWRTKPSTYVVCANDMAVHPDLQRIMARRCGSVIEWPTDHSPFLCRPDLVAELLVDLAQVRFDDLRPGVLGGSLQGQERDLQECENPRSSIPQDIEQQQLRSGSPHDRHRHQGDRTDDCREWVMRINRVVDAETLGRGAELFDSPPVPAFVSRFLASPGHHLLYAWDDFDRAIGFVSGMELTHPDKGTEMYMDELGVVEDARHHGVATSLVEALLAVAKDAGCNGMWGVTDSDNIGAIATYRRAQARGEDPGVVVSWQF